MASWLVWNTGLLIAISSIGAVGGSINNLINKQEVEIPEEIEEIIDLVEESRPEPSTEVIPEAPKQQKQAPATGIRTSGFCKALRWSLPNHKETDEDKCKRWLARRLKGGSGKNRRRT